MMAINCGLRSSCSKGGGLPTAGSTLFLAAGVSRVFKKDRQWVCAVQSAAQQTAHFGPWAVMPTASCRPWLTLPTALRRPQGCACLSSIPASLSHSLTLAC